MSSTVLHRKVGEDLPMLFGGNNAYVYEDSRELLDFSSGPCCFSLGHDNKQVKKAISHQMDDIPNAFGGWWKSKASEWAGASMKREFEVIKPGWFGRVIFQQGGGEAVDFACRIASQYHRERGERRTMFAARKYAYHGCGTLSGALSDYYPRYGMMDAFQEMTRLHVLRLPHPIDFVLVQGSVEEYLYDTLSTGNVAAVIVEPVGGPTIAAWPDPQRYLKELRNVCNDLGILLIFDEILCGAGRCGYMSVMKHYEVEPDMVLLGKGVSAGYQPVSAIVLSQKIVDVIGQGSGQIMFGTAHGAHSMGCAAVAATLDYLHENDLFARVCRRGSILHDAVAKGVEGIDIVKRVSGLGFLAGISLTNGGRYFDSALEVHAKARAAIKKHGVIVYTKGGTMNGKGDFITIAPPFEWSDELIEDAADGVRKGLLDVQHELGL